MQAVMLAAGMGSRLNEHTENKTKCMVEVAGVTLLERAVSALIAAGIKKLVLVVGYKADVLKEFIDSKISGIEIEYVYNHDYASTNNIYSLYLAKDKLIQDDTVLLESDVIFEENLIDDLVKFKHKDAVVLAKHEYWMDGTVALTDEHDNIIEFVDKSNFSFKNRHKYFKTVNIYKFSKDFLQNQYTPFLEAYIKAYGTDKYYESVLKAIAHLSYSKLKAFHVGSTNWYEIDDIQDLDIANTLFAPGEKKAERLEERYGGYWRFKETSDFCYLVNPYFPPEEYIERFKSFITELLTQYPSGMGVQKICAANLFGVRPQNILVGNGAAELIDLTARALHTGGLSVFMPIFNEYVRRFESHGVNRIFSSRYDYAYDVESVLQAVKNTGALLIVNPDNPSGAFIEKSDMLKILDVAKSRNTTVIFDESFIDFADSHVRYTLIDPKIIREYKNVVVIKSISKSYGVPGLRLGVAVSGNTALLNRMMELQPVWNINSFAEYFLQTAHLYRKQYLESCDKIVGEREFLSRGLNDFKQLRVFPSQANYIMCRIDYKTAEEMCAFLLDNENILIKNLSRKDGVESPSVRIAVKDRDQNIKLLNALSRYFKSDNTKKGGGND